ncbi:uncharacterized protein DEA37_0006503 [Paragonimus westermani]|uniref:Apoptosis inhibitor 5 n=1 Tax=Paragonimus westermani TaxID=34504 RepID=A0A5J4NR66_9TREM|nr:uncharacterized protein DEA37_0006503 [Paragonimus westermani]
MTVPSISELYAHYDTVNNETATLEEKEAAYRSILMGIKGGGKEKRLACQFIARFSKQFDSFKEESFNCILDLCDDEDSVIRKQAIHDLLQFAKRIPSFIPRAADVFVQMLQVDDTSELHLISMGLSTLLHMEPKFTLAGIFNQLLTVNPDNPREHVMKFLVDRLKTLPEDKLTTEVEELIVEQTNKVLRDVSEEEFPLLISILSSLRCMSTVPGRQKLVGMITEQALQACPEFNPTDPACIAQIRESGKQAALCVSKNVHARELYIYLLQKVVPKLMELPDSLKDDRLALLRVTAELSNSPGLDLSVVLSTDVEPHLEAAYDALVHFLPEIPQSESRPEAAVDMDKPASDNDSESLKHDAFSGVKFAELECLLCICCQLGRIKPPFFGGYSCEEERETTHVQSGAVRLRLIRPRLQYLSQVAHEYGQSVAVRLNQNGEMDEAKTKLSARNLATNIQNLVRNFFHNPPLFKTTVTLSWIHSASNTTSPGAKRPAPASTNPDSITGPPATSSTRRELPRYTPPVGQWSRAAQPRQQSGQRRGLNQNAQNRNRNW